MWHLEGTSNSFWGKKKSCFRYFKHKAYLEEAKLAQQREIELGNVKAEEARIAQQCEIELAKVAAEEAK